MNEFIAWPANKQREKLKELGIPYSTIYSTEEREQLLHLLVTEGKDRGDAEIEKIVARARTYAVEASKRSRHNKKAKSSKQEVAVTTEQEDPTPPQQLIRYKIHPKTQVKFTENVCHVQTLFLDTGCWGCWAWRWCSFTKKNRQPQPPHKTLLDRMDQTKLKELTRQAAINEEMGEAPWAEEWMAEV